MLTETMANKNNLLESIRPYEQPFMELIKIRLGIIIKHQMSDLYKTIAQGCQKFNCQPADYLQMLRTCEDDSPLLEHLIAGITIGETYFFRDKNQMQILNDLVFAEMIHKKRLENNLTLRIWSAGCSSGEEIYTMAIIISELLPDRDKWNLNFLGTDINVKMLQKALSGRYSEWSMRSISDYYKKKYFLQEGKDYILATKIKNLAHFNFINLNDDSYPSIFNGTNAQDLILCRNVLIYFSPEAIAKLMHKLSLSLAPEGYLMLGASDPVYLENTDLIFGSHAGALLKRPVFSLQKVESNKKHSTSVSLPVLSSYEPPLKSLYQDAVRSNKNTWHVQKKLDSKDTIKEYLSKAQWQKALDLILQNEMSESKKTTFLLNAKANALANLGRLEEAIKAFKICFIQDPTNKENYFLYALTLLELNKLDECEQALRQTLFLDHQYVPGHFQLGLLLIKNKKHEAGLKSLKNALSIAKDKDPAALIPGSQGLSYGRFSEILKNEINLHLPKGHAYVD